MLPRLFAACSVHDEKLSDKVLAAISLEQSADDLHMVRLMPLLLPSSLASLKSRMVYLFDAGLPRLSWKKAVKQVSLCLSVNA